MLDILMQARDADTGKPLSDRDIRDEVMTMLMAGHESTSVARFVGVVPARSAPRRWRAMAEENERVPRAGRPRPPTWKVLSLTSMVIDETLRLYPPAWSDDAHPARQ